MTAANFPKCLATILTYEGGWSDDPQDPGGATMKGVTLKTFSNYLGRQASPMELHAISDDDLEAIYRSRYWNPIRGDDLPSGVDLIVFDTSVNSGPGRAVRLLQQAVGAHIDGAIGPGTLTAVAAQASTDTINKFSELHEAYYRSLPTFDHFGKGWMNRLHAVQQLALEMA